MINDYEATQPITTDATPISSGPASNNDVISTLNGLIATCRDGQEGFKEAAEGIGRSDLKSLFYEFSQQRVEFLGVLQGLVRSLGGEPETDGTLSGAVHRGWIDLKAAITGQDEKGILSECERGEDVSKEAYADALTLDLPANIADVLRQQSQAIQAAHNRIKELRDAGSSKSATGGF